MSDNKKYYYIKVKESYFDKDNIKIIEAQENGYIYSLIILKLYLKSAKYDGCLMMTDAIPYSPDDVDVIAKVINHDISHVRDAINLAIKFDLITIMDTGEIWMNDIQNFIGESSTEADRIRRYRKQIADKCTNVQINPCTNVQENPDKATPELELERDIELKLDTSKSKKKRPKTDKPIKHKHGEYKHIHLTTEEFEKLKDKVDDREKWIKILDEGIELKGYKYKNHYLAILNWYMRDGVNKANKEVPEKTVYKPEPIKDDRTSQFVERYYEQRKNVDRADFT